MTAAYALAAVLFGLCLLYALLPRSRPPHSLHRWGNGAPIDNPFVHAPEGSRRVTAAEATGWKPIDESEEK